MPDKVPTFLVKANGFVFPMDANDAVNADIVVVSLGRFNLVKDHQSVDARVEEIGSTGKQFRVEIEGDVFDIDIRDELDQVLEKMGFGQASGKQLKEIKAPMPGLVLDINVHEGQELQAGDKLLILEAMKMENSIVVSADAKIKKIVVAAGQAVEKGQVLVELE